MLDFSTNSFDFPVETQPVFDQNGNEIVGSKCIMRTDTNQVLGVHGSRYHLVPHDDVVNSIEDAVMASDITSDYKIKVKVIEDGRKMRGEVIFPNLTVQPQVGDIVQFRVSFFNSYDGSWSFSQSADGLRLWCMNGCTNPIGVARSRFKHTQSINIEGAANKIKSGISTFYNNREMWQSWMTVGITDEFAESFFKKTIAKAPSRQQLVTKSNEKQLENLLGIWANEKAQLGSNKWALYNCMTYWATHTQDLRNPEVARRNREDAIAKAMTHKAWEIA